MNPDRRSLLFLAPKLDTISQLWLQRMMQAIERHVVAIGCENHKQTDWNQIPIFSLKELPGTFSRKVQRRLGILKKPTSAIQRGERLLRLLKKLPNVRKILINFINYAVSFEPELSSIKLPIYVHAHGFDSTWDLRLFENPERHQHPADYVDKVRKLGEYVTFIVNSQVSQKRLTDIGIHPDRIRIKYMGVPISPEPIQRDLHKQPLTILYLNRLIDSKGPDLVIRAFDLAAQKGINAKLVMGGDGSMRAECESLRVASSFKDRIAFLGAVPWEQGEPLRREADIFTAHSCTGSHTKQEEAFGVSFVEAMAAGLPIVSGASGSLPEIVTNGVNGILFPPGDIEAHSEALLKLANDPELRQKMGNAARQIASEKFSSELEKKKLLEILDLPKLDE
jgi:glycosyltransferase involved in cell wall biosynthesis